MQLINDIAVLTPPEAHVVQALNCGEYIGGSAAALLRAMDPALADRANKTGMALVKMRLGQVVRNRLAELLMQPTVGAATPVHH